MAKDDEMNLNELPAELARSRVLCTKDAATYCGLDVQMWRRMMKAGSIPQPLKLSERKFGWRLGDLQAWIDRQAEAALSSARRRMTSEPI